MQRGRLLILFAALIAAGSLLLPYFSAEALGDINASAATGYLPVAALGAAALVAVAGDRGDSLGGLAAVAAAAAVTMALVLTGALLLDASLANRNAAALDVVAHIGSGLWTLVLAAVVGLFGVIVGMSRRLS